MPRKMSIKICWLSSKMLFDVDVLLNDVHLKLEDADHDVIHVVSSPLSFKVVMKALRMVKIKLLIWRNMIV